MYDRKRYVTALFASSEYAKYQSDAANQKMIEFLEEAQWPPSELTLARAIARLELPRTDGGSTIKDRNEMKRTAQAQFDAAVANAVSTFAASTSATAGSIMPQARRAYNVT